MIQCSSTLRASSAVSIRHCGHYTPIPQSAVVTSLVTGPSPPRPQINRPHDRMTHASSDATDTTPVPFLKWAGGKRWLVKRYPSLFPSSPPRLIEPFCGSSAVFFSISPRDAILSDSNARLIECYRAIRDDTLHFVHHFGRFCKLHSRAFFYRCRSISYSDPTERAAQFLYLNRVCFNGIYRENLLGQFNVPIGTKPSASLSTDDFGAVASALQRATVVTSDFEPTVDTSEAGDFLYVDPPYVTKHNYNGFAKYNRQIFSWSDQERLAKAVIRANQRGVSIVVSNADHTDVRALYMGHFRIQSLTRSTVIASKSCHRGKTTEMVATNVL